MFGIFLFLKKTIKKKKSFPNSGSRIITFCGGPATSGPGAVVGTDTTEKIRSHFDIQHNNSNYRYSKPAQQLIVLLLLFFFFKKQIQIQISKTVNLI